MQRSNRSQTTTHSIPPEWIRWGQNPDGHADSDNPRIRECRYYAGPGGSAPDPASFWTGTPIMSRLWLYLQPGNQLRGPLPPTTRRSSIVATLHCPLCIRAAPSAYSAPTALVVIAASHWISASALLSLQLPVEPNWLRPGTVHQYSRFDFLSIMPSAPSSRLFVPGWQITQTRYL